MKRLMISAFFVAALVSIAAAQDLVGDWQGPLTTQSGELRIVLHVTKTPDGALKATMDSPDQGIGGIPVDSISAEGGKVHFTVSVINGNFEGSLKGNGSINGNWTQGASTQKMQLVLSKTTTPLKLTHDPAPPSDIDGTWEGTYEVPADAQSMTKMHVIVHFKNTADGLTATVDLPEGNIKGWPATAVARKGSSVKVAMKQIGVIFQAKTNKQMDAMSGDWTQGDGPSRALVLKKTKDEAADAQKADAQKK
jgi:hypothetical protein